MTIFETNQFHLDNSTGHNKTVRMVKPRHSSIISVPSSIGQVNHLKNGGDLGKSDKRVKFADECGRKLLHVVYLENINDMFYEYKTFRCPSRNKTPKCVSSKITQNTNKDTNSNDNQNVNMYTWVIRFVQPGSLYNRFKSDLSNLKVKLATAVIDTNTDTNKIYLRGIIKVLNLSFEKKIFVRLSTDAKWSSYRDFPAKFHQSNVSDSICGVGVDDFEFDSIDLPNLNKLDCITCSKDNTRLEFVICYESVHENVTKTFWDNNNGNNYHLNWCFNDSNKQNSDSNNNNVTTATTCMRDDCIDKNNNNNDHNNNNNNNNNNISDIKFNDHFGSSPGRASSSLTTPFPLPSIFPTYTKDYRPNFTQFESNFTDYRSWNHYSNELSFY